MSGCKVADGSGTMLVNFGFLFLFCFTFINSLTQMVQIVIFTGVQFHAYGWTCRKKIRT